ncbi:14606_t:CDS:1 [Racocetra persica]|uniref:14606_t:CDS:1 n=1 Tax=Racocetra persica TaxID=160502 RepID=A0ACA9RR41_9GLOM|nr:14606_t:CDS:1 [Racocetra persica]
MSLFSEAKKCLHESLQQQCLNQKSAKYNEAKRLFTGLTDLDYKPGHTEHIFYKYWLASNDRASSANKNDTALLDTYQPEEIHSQYIVRVARKGYTVIDYPSEVYGIPDAHECIDGNQPLHLVINIDARQKPDPSNLKLPSLDNEKINHEDLIS